MALLALQAGLKFVGFFSLAVRVDTQHGFFDRLPAAVVQHDREDRQLVGLRRGIDRAGRGEMKAAITHDLNHPQLGLGQLGPQGHAAAVAQAAPGATHERERQGARNLIQHGEGVANRLVHHDVLRGNGCTQFGAQIGG